MVISNYILPKRLLFLRPNNVDLELDLLVLPLETFTSSPVEGIPTLSKRQITGTSPPV
jgi:hypothetical protein